MRVFASLLASSRNCLACLSLSMCCLPPDMIAALSETTSGPWLPGLRDTMFSTAEGRAILRDRPRIHSETIDLDALRALPDGTVGRTYCDWLERCNTSPDTRLPVQHVDDPELAYVLQRYR